VGSDGGVNLNSRGAYVAATQSVDGDVVVYNGVASMGVRPTLNPPATWPQAGFGASRVKARRSTALALTTSWNRLDWNDEEFDSDNMHDNATNPNRLVAKTAGQYEFICTVNVTGGTGMVFGTSFMALSVMKNSDTIADGPAGSYVPWIGGIGMGLQVSGVADLALNDYVSAMLYQNFGGAPVLSVSASSYFAMRRIV
jgi:hypothetical protein